MSKIAAGFKEAFVFIGPPTSGKSSHAEAISEIIGRKLIRGKDIVPELVTVYEEVRSLIPDEIFLPRLQERLVALNSRFTVFDNVPRTRSQALVLAYWAISTGYMLHTVALEITEEEALDRCRKREVCQRCQSSYHPRVKPPKMVGICDKDSEPLVRRPGDKEEEIIRAYRDHLKIRAEIVPVLQDYGPIHYVDAMSTIAEVSLNLVSRLRQFIVDRE